MHGVFVTGTGTGVGKTTFSSSLIALLKKKKVNVGVMKPFATGEGIFSERHRSQDTALLAKAAGVQEVDKQLNPFYYSVPASPLMASEIVGKPAVQLAKAIRALRTLAKKHDFLVVEGIGGIMVPLTAEATVADFAALTQLPVLIVAEAKLGTLNHTLLTVMACNNAGLKIIGIIVNRMPRSPSLVEERTPELLERLTGIPVLAVIPFSKNQKSVIELLENNVRLINTLEF